MGFEGLDQLEIIQGTFTLIFVVISTIIGLSILYTYFSLKRKDYFTGGLAFVGLSWIFLCSAWWSSATSYIVYVLFDYTIGDFWFLLIGNAFIPLALLCWIYSFTYLAYPRMKKILVSIYLVICIPYEIFLIYFLFTDMEIVGTRTGIFYLSPNLYSLLFQIFGIVTAFITGILFSKKLLKSDNAKIHQRGIFLLIAFLSFTIGGILDAVLTYDALTLILIRLILVSSSIFYYLGFKKWYK